MKTRSEFPAGDMRRRQLRPLSESAAFAPLPETTAHFGLSRSTIYRAAADGKITLRKAGRTILVDLATVRRFMAELPQASIQPDRSRREAVAA